ncbi:hypothetical protein [Butyrivibrio proteoclasticus]|uniref:hypothetical protein n=1 Tax=Butyrivibrio proteoclasticus TaxID=43305 RepID=UPI000A5F0977|nr:hypothetical protein [Butyrivibrio proteoclasticus]
MPEEEMDMFYEDDSWDFELPDDIKKMSVEERKMEMDRLFNEMKSNPRNHKKEKMKLDNVKFFF